MQRTKLPLTTKLSTVEEAPDIANVLLFVVHLSIRLDVVQRETSCLALHAT